MKPSPWFSVTWRDLVMFCAGGVLLTAYTLAAASQMYDKHEPLALTSCVDSVRHFHKGAR